MSIPTPPSGTAAQPPARSQKLARAQAISGLVFLVFVVLHLSTHLVALGGPDAYAAAQAALRTIYQAPVLELGFAGALLVHMAAAVLALRARRRPRGHESAPPVPRRMYWHRVGGWFLLVVILGHIGATRVLPALHGVDIGFGGVAFALWWLPLLFWPYYAALALFGLLHAAHGTVLALGRLRRPLPKAMRGGPGYWVPLTVLGIALVLALLAFGGVLFETPDPTDNDYARIYADQFGVVLQP